MFRSLQQLKPLFSKYIWMKLSVLRLDFTGALSMHLVLTNFVLPNAATLTLILMSDIALQCSVECMCTSNFSRSPSLGSFLISLCWDYWTRKSISCFFFCFMEGYSCQSQNKQEVSLKELSCCLLETDIMTCNSTISKIHPACATPKLREQSCSPCGSRNLDVGIEQKLLER